MVLAFYYGVHYPVIFNIYANDQSFGVFCAPLNCSYADFSKYCTNKEFFLHITNVVYRVTLVLPPPPPHFTPCHISTHCRVWPNILIRFVGLVVRVPASRSAVLGSNPGPEGLPRVGSGRRQITLYYCLKNLGLGEM